MINEIKSFKSLQKEGVRLNLLNDQVDVAGISGCLEVEMCSTSDCVDALHSWSNLTSDSVGVFEGAMTVVLAYDEMHWNFSQ